MFRQAHAKEFRIIKHQQIVILNFLYYDFYEPNNDSVCHHVTAFVKTVWH